MKMKRYMYLVLGSIAMCVFGLMYNWTVFSPVVQVELGVSASKVANVFAFCQICFCAGGFLSGFIFYKVSFKKSMFISSIMILAGLLLTSKAEQVIEIYLGYSILFSFGAGFAYKALLTTILTWFSDKPGVASGVLVMGAGLSAFVFNVPSSLLIQAYGWRIAMITLACIAFVVAFAIALIVSPKSDKQTKRNNPIEQDDTQISTCEMMKSPEFYMYFVWSVVLLAGCSSLSGTSVSCGTSFGVSATFAASLSMIISLFNSISRVIYGIIYDKIGRKMAMGIATALFTLAVILLFCAFETHHMVLLSCSFIFIGLSFGAVPTISSAYIMETFGTKYYPSNFSVQGCYTLFSSLFGTMLFSMLFTETGSYEISYMYLIVYAFSAIILFVSLNVFMKRKRTCIQT